MSNKKQTAVEFLEEQLFELRNPTLNQIEIIKQAKELEKEQIEHAFCDGADDEYEHHINGSIRKNSEQYYNEIFNKLKTNKI